MFRPLLTRHVFRAMARFTPSDTQERCGIILENERTGMCALIEIPNRHTKPDLHFCFTDQDVRAVVTHYPKPWRVVAVFHTHIGERNEQPSPHDYREMARLRDVPGREHMLGVIYNVKTGSVVCYNGNHVEFQLHIPKVEVSSVHPESLPMAQHH